MTILGDEKCTICGKPLVGQTWTDDDDYGDVHERCLEAKLGGFDSVEDMDADD